MCASRCHFDKGRHSLSSKGSSNLKWRVETYLQGACRDYLIPMAASIAEKKSSLKFAPQKKQESDPGYKSLVYKGERAHNWPR